MALSGRVCIVTGASRGIGKGIALQLGEAGATVYITARTLKAKEGVTGSLQETAAEVESRGGRCIPVQCDHKKDEDITALFETVRQEQNGRLDLLVNNAYSAVNLIAEAITKKQKFWQLPPSVWDDVNNVGLRNHYVCTVHATKMMLEQGTGLIVWVSSAGGLQYLFNVAYGVGKAACDRMAVDCAHELRKTDVHCVSLWPGLVRTENFMDLSKSVDPSTVSKNGSASMIANMTNNKFTSETVEYSGKAIVHLLKDSNRKQKSGKIVLASDLADEYGFTDTDGIRPYNFTSLKFFAASRGYSKLQWILPRWLKIPKWVLAVMSSKF